MIAIVNTGPLVYLSQLKRLTLLRDLYEPMTPASVMAEIQAWRSESRAIVQTATRTWLKVASLADPTLANTLVPQIDLGEAEVIALAVELGVQRVLLDDQDARRCARLYGLQPLGTLGLLLEAKQAGLLASIRPEIDRLAQTNFFFSNALIRAVLQAAGEEP